LNKKSQRPTNKTLSKSSKSKPVHNPVHNIEVCNELQQIINAWPSLPEHIKAAIKAMIETFSANSK